MGLLDNLKDKVDDVLEKTDIDDKIKAKADDVLDKTDMVLQMTVNPGYGGQSYIPAMTEKIRALRQKLDEAGYPEIPIQIDGGVDRSTILTALEAGASVIVAGSKVFKGDIRANAEWFLGAIRSAERGCKN